MATRRRRAGEVFAKDRGAWRRWLREHHATRDEVHLVFVRKASGKQCIGYGEAVEEALCFGWIDGVKRKLDDERYCYRFSPRRPGSRWSESNKRRVAALIEAGRMEPAGMAKVEEAKRSGAWEARARPKVPARMPKELAGALRGSKTARRAYDSLTAAQKRQWLGWIADAKKAETRERRAASAAKQLASGAKYPGRV